MAGRMQRNRPTLRFLDFMRARDASPCRYPNSSYLAGSGEKGVHSPFLCLVLEPGIHHPIGK